MDRQVTQTQFATKGPEPGNHHDSRVILSPQAHQITPMPKEWLTQPLNRPYTYTRHLPAKILQRSIRLGIPRAIISNMSSHFQLSLFPEFITFPRNPLSCLYPIITPGFGPDVHHELGFYYSGYLPEFYHFPFLAIYYQGRHRHERWTLQFSSSFRTDLFLNHHEH